jgi:hypothetical protein
VKYKFTPQEVDLVDSFKNIRFDAKMIVNFIAYLYEYRYTFDKILWVRGSMKSAYGGDGLNDKIDNIIKKFAELEKPIQIIFASYDDNNEGLGSSMSVTLLDKNSDLKNIQLIISETSIFNIHTIDSNITDFFTKIKTLGFTAINDQIQILEY